MLAACLLLAAPATLPAQDPVERPQVRISVVDERPFLDGVLDEEVWQRATVIDGFIEVVPVEGRTADPPTEIRIMRDSEFLYLGMTMWEPEPGEMVLQNMRRDAFLNDDDRVEFLFDTFQDSQTAFFFQISAGGSRGDALLNDNGRRFNKPWNTFWEARVVVHGDRWVAEVAIPFRAIPFGDQDGWGVNFERFRGADRSRTRWSGAQRQFRLNTVSIAGVVTGFAGIDHGIGVEVVPFVRARAENKEMPADSDLFGDIGGEINVRITPQLTGSITVNTDFAETEVDERQVNLTRFALFFPEKRDFFLQDANLFDFGEQSGFGSRSRNLIPFFSRRIGLDGDGNVVPLEGGVRLAGRVGPMDIGALAVRTGDAAATAVPAGELFVVRPSFRVDEGVSVGGLFTAGNQVSAKSNAVVGADFRVSSTDFLDGNFNLNTYVLRSADGAADDQGSAYGAQAFLNTSNWDFELETLATQESFLPALGFVRRPGERLYKGRVRFEPRPENGPVRLFFFELDPRVWTDLSGDTQSFRVVTTFFGVELHSGDRFSLEHKWEGDVVSEIFEPVASNYILPGRYDWQTLGASLRSSEARALSGSITLEAGSWYNGSVGRLRLQSDWRPNPTFYFGLEYREDRVDLPGGAFTTRVQIGRFDVSFSPDVSLESLVQADNITDTLGMQSRLRFIHSDRREAFLVLGMNWEELPGGALVPVSQDLTLKLVFAIRF